MSNLDNVTKLKHINSLAAQTASAINELLINGLSGVGGTADVFTGATSLAGGASGLVPAPAAGDDEKFLRGDGTWALPAGGASSDVIVAGSTVLSTTPATVDGGMWYEDVNDATRIFIRKEPYVYGFNYDTLQYIGAPEEKLISYLPCDVNPTADAFGNTWSAVGGVSIDTNTKKFGAGSLHCPPEAYLRASNLFDINTEQWTFDAYFYLVSGSADSGIVLVSAAETFEKRCSGVQWLNSGIFLTDINQESWVTNLNYTISNHYTGQWTHMAIVKNGLHLKFFVNGSLLWEQTLSNNLKPGDSFYLGGAPTWGNGEDVYFDNVRFYKDYARWTADFTPPDASDYVLSA